MTGKAKPKKHTAKEIAAKIDAATTNRGGGKAGLEDRTGADKGGHAKLACPICKATAPDIKSMQIHHEARHPKLPFEEDKLLNLHASGTSTSSAAAAAAVAADSKLKPGIRGSHKKGRHRLLPVFGTGRGWRLERDPVTMTNCRIMENVDGLYHAFGTVPESSPFAMAPHNWQ